MVLGVMDVTGCARSSSNAGYWYDFKGLDSSAARVRMPRLEEFPKLLSAITEINELN